MLTRHLRLTNDADVPHRLSARSGHGSRQLHTEAFAHLKLPLLDQSGRADDQGVADPVAQDELLQDEPGLDGLAQADVVSDEQERPGHVEGTDEGLELVGTRRECHPRSRPWR